MKLLNLAARICNAFNASRSAQMRMIQKVKDNHCRDVVTTLDIKLHDISEEFVREQLPGCIFLSEESANEDWSSYHLSRGDWLIVDPLDGSNNHALEMPNYGYMAAHLQNGKLNGAAIVLPEHSQYIVFDSGQSLFAQPLTSHGLTRHGTVYYAYPPHQNEQARQTRGELFDLIDTNSAGMYRYGSACAGLYQLLCGKHMAFIAHGIRVWDAIAFMPILKAQGVQVMYNIHAGNITMVATRKPSFLEHVAQILQKNQNLNLHHFESDVLKFEKL